MKLILSAILLIPHLIFAQEIEQDCNFKPIKINDSVYHVYLTNTQFLDAYSETNCLLIYLRDGEGKPDGTIIVFDNLKRKRWLVNFKDQKRTNELVWYANGKLEREIFYKEDIYYDQTLNRKDGTLHSKIVNGNSDTEKTYIYFNNGVLKKKIEIDSALVHDKRPLQAANIFRAKEWYINGILKETGLLFARTYKFGIWTYYDKNGKVTKVEEYKESNRVIYSIWDPFDY
jgi:antitoxin component YwqK of YwqJK toxin-antitoxin module